MKSAVIWCTNGGDYEYWRYSIASMRLQIKTPVDFFVITTPDSDLHGLDYDYGLRRIDPSPHMDTLGFTKQGYDALGKRWPVAILWKLCVPLIGEFKKYDSVITLDTDVMAMPTSSRHTVDDILRHPLGEFEVGGVPDLYEPLDRASMLIQDMVTGDIRDELQNRVWSKHGYGCQSYISAGLFLWNIPVIDLDIDWYIRRCKSFWRNISRYVFPEQDFVNQYMAVDSRLQSAFGARADGNGPYVVADACMRHFTGVGKRLMFNMASKIPEISPRARIDQADLHPRKSDIVSDRNTNKRRCIVFTADDNSDSLDRLNYSINSFQDVCGSGMSDISMFVLEDGTYIRDKLDRSDIKCIDVGGMFDASGFRRLSNWRSGWLGWDWFRLPRLFIPFIPELAGYDLVLHIDGDMIATSDKMLGIFDEDVTGYDCAMSAEFSVRDGLYFPHKRVRACKAFLMGQYDIKDSNYILGRLNNGIYFSSSVCLFNMREFRKTLGSVSRLYDLGAACVGNGVPAVESDLFNSVCYIKPVSGSYNTAGTTHFHGEPTYCVHNYGKAKDGERYPKMNIAQYV